MATKNKNTEGAVSQSDVFLAENEAAAASLFDAEDAQTPFRSLAEQTDTSPQVKYVIFKLVDTKRKGGVHIPASDDLVYNPKTKRRERVYLIRGASSIWQSDLVEFLKDKEYVDQNMIQPYFEGGICRVPHYDELMLEYMRVVKHCIDSPNRRSGSRFEYFEYDPVKQAKAAHDRELLEIEMAIAAKGLAEEDARKMASFLGIAFNDDFGIAKDISAIRTELMIKAKKNPVQFQNCLKSKEVEIHYMVRRAITGSLIDFGTEGGGAVWAGQGRLIGHIPKGAQPIKYLTELAMTNSEAGREFLNDLKTFVK